MNVLIFSGGTGSKALQTGFHDMYGEMINLQIATNAYDNGLSTGAVRKVMDGKILGPSDVRKNQLFQSSLKYTVLNKNIPENNLIEKRKLKEFLDIRLSASSSDEMERKCINLLSELNMINIEDKNIMLVAIRVFFDLYNSKLITYHDFSISNIIYASLAYSNDYSLEKASMIMSKILGIPEDKILLTSDESLFLQAITEDGKIIYDEGDIVNWSNPKNKIKRIRLVDVDGNVKIPVLSESVQRAINKADIIIFSSGTQWSSLIPTYINVGFKNLIENSKAKKYLVMNNVADKDMYGVSSVELLNILEEYLPLKDITIVLNSQASPEMQLENDKYRFIKGELSRNMPEPIMLHRPKDLVNLIMTDYYTEYINSDAYVFDFDGTLVGRGESFIEESKHNLGILNGMYSKKKFILTGNSLNHINTHIKESLVDIVYSDGGNSRCVWSDPEDKYIFEKYINEKYVMSISEIDNIYTELLSIKIPVYKIENRNDLIISIKPLNSIERKKISEKLIQMLGDNYEIKINGRTTIDIMKRGYTKAVAFEDDVFLKCKNIMYVGDELERGNDEPIRQLKNIHFYPVKNPSDTLTLLKSIWK